VLHQLTWTALKALSARAPAVAARLSAIWAANAMWTIPATRMESRREHRVPLSAPAVALLKELYTEAGNPYLFIGPKEGGDAQRHRSRSGAPPRRPQRDGARIRAHECTALEISLAHATGSDVERSYRRGDMLDKRRKLMEQWAAFCMTPRQAGKVVVMRGRS
jgi:integrase